jgi:hypothetical protein
VNKRKNQTNYRKNAKTELRCKTLAFGGNNSRDRFGFDNRTFAGSEVKENILE